jgi:hypothetical protein
MTFQKKEKFIWKNRSIAVLSVFKGGIKGMKKRCFRSLKLQGKGPSTEYVHYNKYARRNRCSAVLINRGRLLMNVTLSFTGLMSLYFLYQMLS